MAGASTLQIREYQKLELYTAQTRESVTGLFADFKIGRIKLAKHLDIRGQIGVLDVDPDFAKQLLLEKESNLDSKRVPIYVCRLCASLGCGAITVRVVRTEDSFIWRNFACEYDYEDDLHQSDFMIRTGPFEFEAEKYLATIRPYTRKS